MTDGIQAAAEDEKGVATCILCGKPLKGFQTVIFRDWHAHAECAQEALEKQVDNFNRIPFWIGSLGCVFGIILAFPFLLLPMQVYNPTPYWIAFLGMAISLFFQVFGFYGFASNYDEGTGIICAIIAVAAGVCHLFTTSLFIEYGYDTQYYDPETGLLVVRSIPNMEISLFLSFGFLLLLMALVAIMVLLLGQSATFGFDNRIIVVILVGAAALMPFVPLNFYIEIILVTALFLSAQVPKEWKKVEIG